MRQYLHRCILTVVCRVTFCLESQSWNHNTIHCRDNGDRPVDWWIILKPPKDAASFLDSGRNFSFVSSETRGKWQESSVYVTGTSMLQYTLNPIYRSTYSSYAAVAAYDNRESTFNSPVGSTAKGLLMADVLGGLWLSHTVPGLLDMTRSVPHFPEDEIVNGHLLMCLSVGIPSLNKIAANLKYAALNFTYIKIPGDIKNLLDEWNLSNNVDTSKRKLFSYLEFPTEGGTNASVLVRSPGETGDVYTKFAKIKRIVLDVYAHSKYNYMEAICGEQFSVRNIDKISLKHTEKVKYINRNLDHTKFAVSTAADWQRQGAGPRQYWSCISNLDKEEKSGNGGILMCLDDYEVWVNFDTLKIKEPDC